jgi:hypothetical protein
VSGFLCYRATTATPGSHEVCASIAGPPVALQLPHLAAAEVLEARPRQVAAQHPHAAQRSVDHSVGDVVVHLRLEGFHVLTPLTAHAEEGTHACPVAFGAAGTQTVRKVRGLLDSLTALFCCTK